MRSTSSPAKSTISSKRRSISARLTPRIEALRYPFSRPDRSGWKPAPNSSRAASRPTVRISPDVGRRMPAMHLSRVDLPDPLCPRRPEGLPRLDVEVDVAQSPEVLELDLAEMQRPFLERRELLVVQPEP